MAFSAGGDGGRRSPEYLALGVSGEGSGAIVHKQLWIGLLLGVIAYAAPCASVQSQPSPGNAQKTARIALVQEFVRELEVLYRLQETAKKEFAEDSSANGKLGRP